MKFSPRKINWFVLFKIPSAYLSGVRVTDIFESKVSVSVKYRWINQNPFKSMYWATQGMASELATGILMMKKIAESNEKIGMLVTSQKGEFVKKARGRIQFNCEDNGEIALAITNAIKSGEGEKIVLSSSGVDENGDVVSNFVYEWSIKVKK
jgi:hypothetical protein